MRSRRRSQARPPAIDGRVLRPDGSLQLTDVLIERGKIVKIGDPLDDWRAELIRSLLLSPEAVGSRGSVWRG
jgi:hypothetical protein